MSFGKDQSHLTSIPVYGGSTTQRAANAGRKKKRSYGSKRPYWADTFRPPETGSASIRIIPGEYKITKVDDKQLIEEVLPWYEFVEHYSGTHRRGGICSGGPWFFDKSKRTPCHGCDKRESEPRNKKTMSRSDKFAFTVIDMGLFHQVPQIDRQTHQVRKNQQGEPYLEWVKCTGRGCQNCHHAIQNRYGYIQPWTMSKVHFNSLNAYGDGIGHCCVTCRGRNTIHSQAWFCGNQQCQSLIFDMNTTTASDEQIREVVNQPFTCPACHQTNYAVESISCTNCAQYGWTPVRATIFDVDLQVAAPRTGENNSTNLQIVGMSDPKPLDPQFEDLLKFKPNLENRFSPTPLDKQAEMWQMTGAGQQAPSQGGYGAQQPPPPPASYAQPYGNTAVQHPSPQQPQYQPAATQQPQYQQPAAPGYPQHQVAPQQPQVQPPGYGPGGYPPPGYPQQ